MSVRLVIKPQHCIGCRACELACAFSHGGGNGQMGAARCQTVTVGKDEFVPMMCLQCDNAACVQACPVDAITRDEDNKLVLVDNDLCIRCMACTVACQFGNMHFDPAAELIHKCDLCQTAGGTPRCAMFCTTECLSVETV